MVKNTLRLTETKSEKVTCIFILNIKQFEADFLWKVSLKILNSGIILKTSTHMKSSSYSTHMWNIKALGPEFKS